MSTPNYLFVCYRINDHLIDNNIINGDVVSITTPKKGETNVGSKAKKTIGYTKIPFDKEIWETLITGKKTIDVKKSTKDNGVLSERPSIFRLEATQLVSMNTKEWKKSPHFTSPASKQNYIIYIKEFLKEFTRITKHIPIEKLIEYYPHAWVFPTEVTINVGRDGIIFDYEYPSRPEKHSVLIDMAKIVGSLFIFGTKIIKYTSNGPNSIHSTICDDEHYTYIIGKHEYTPINNETFGNPNFVILEKKYHSFMENVLITNADSLGKIINKKIRFSEIFGDISKSNFTPEKAKKRAKLYAENWITRNISNGSIDTAQKLRLKYENFHSLIDNKDTSENEIEKFIDKNTWIIERSIGYKKFHSQITVESKFISRSDDDIRPDKFIEKEDGYCDILDLKKATTPIITGKKNRKKQSAGLSDAEAQIDKYTEFANEPKVREELSKKNINILKPKGIVIIGRTTPENITDWIDIKKRLSIEAYSYDEILQRLETIILWVEKITSKN